MFLIQFEYEYYCQGWEWTWTYLLVKNVKTPEEAIEKIKNMEEYRSARHFKNLTLE